MRTLNLVVLFVASALPACKAEPPPPAQEAELRIIRVAAAADLSFAFQELGAKFQASTGIKPVFSFGSTGLLAKQVAEGAPFDVFAAANTSFVDQVVASGACKADSKSIYARGRIVLWTKKSSGSHPQVLTDLSEARFARIAIANPEHAPYGRAAEEALASAGILDAVKPKLVYAENVQQTLQFAQSGNVEAAIVALSLASVTPDGDYLPVDDKLHKPIEQGMVVCGKDHDADARAFTAFVGSTEGRSVMRRFGFLLPGEELANAK